MSASAYRDPDTGWTGLVEDEFSAPLHCGQPMYECHTEHTDGQHYWHCHSCGTSRVLIRDGIEDGAK